MSNGLRTLNARKIVHVRKVARSRAQRAEEIVRRFMRHPPNVRLLRHARRRKGTPNPTQRRLRTPLHKVMVTSTVTTTASTAITSVTISW